MNCQDLNRLLAAGEPLSPAALAHLNNCAGCSRMLRALDPPAAVPDPARLALIQKTISSSLQPVSPLPSDARLAVLLLAAFAVFSIITALLIGVKGYSALTINQRIIDYGVILLLAAFSSGTVIKEFIPGTVTRLRPPFLIVIGLISLAVSTVFLFQSFDLNRFLRLGLPCLGLGLVGAAASALLGSLLLRFGVVTAPRRAGLLTGFLAGLAGFAVLALHCPYLNAPHILVWHFAPLVLAACGGALVGALLEREPYTKT